MKVLVACEYSGIVRDAFLEEGHDAYSCDLLPTKSPIPDRHYEGDVTPLLTQGWDLLIAHPPCTHLAVSGARWFTEGKKPWSLQEEALNFVRLLMNAPIPRICIENPVSVISSKIRKPEQIIQPWEFGHPEQKRTCLWLKNLPLLQKLPEKNVYEHMMTLPKKERERVWWMGGGKGHERSAFFPGFAEAMVRDWT
jgi:hypothetical protein